MQHLGKRAWGQLILSRVFLIEWHYIMVRSQLNWFIYLALSFRLKYILFGTGLIEWFTRSTAEGGGAPTSVVPRLGIRSWAGDVGGANAFCSWEIWKSIGFRFLHILISPSDGNFSPSQSNVVYWGTLVGCGCFDEWSAVRSDRAVHRISLRPLDSVLRLHTTTNFLSSNLHFFHWRSGVVTLSISGFLWKFWFQQQEKCSHRKYTSLGAQLRV